MTKYWYRIRLSRPVKPEKAKDLTSNLVRLFESGDVRKVDGRSFDLTTAMEPVEAGAALDRFCAKHGSAAFVVGSQIFLAPVPRRAAKHGSAASVVRSQRPQ